MMENINHKAQTIPVPYCVQVKKRKMAEVRKWSLKIWVKLTKMANKNEQDLQQQV